MLVIEQEISREKSRGERESEREILITIVNL